MAEKEERQLNKRSQKYELLEFSIQTDENPDSRKSHNEEVYSEFEMFKSISCQESRFKGQKKLCVNCDSSIGKEYFDEECREGVEGPRRREISETDPKKKLCKECLLTNLDDYNIDGMKIPIIGGNAQPNIPTSGITADVTTNDQYLMFDDEGAGSQAGSLSSIEDDFNNAAGGFDNLQQYGQKFSNLNSLYNPPEIDSNKDNQFRISGNEYKNTLNDIEDVMTKYMIVENNMKIIKSHMNASTAPSLISHLRFPPPLLPDDQNYIDNYNLFISHIQQQFNQFNYKQLQIKLDNHQSDLIRLNLKHLVKLEVNDLDNRINAIRENIEKMLEDEFKNSDKKLKSVINKKFEVRNTIKNEEKTKRLNNNNVNSGINYQNNDMTQNIANINNNNQQFINGYYNNNNYRGRGYRNYRRRGYRNFRRSVNFRGQPKKS